MAQAENVNRRSKSSNVLQSLVMPKTRNRMSKDITHEQALSLRSPNAQTVPLLPPDHPHANVGESENVGPIAIEEKRSPRKKEQEQDRKEHKRSKSVVSLRSLVGGDSKSSKDKDRKAKDQSPEKKSLRRPKKEKSSTGLSALFAKKNKSVKDLSQPAQRDEPQTPSSSVNDPADTPIWAQFASQKDTEEDVKYPRVRPDVSDEKLRGVKSEIDRYTPKEYDPYAQRDFQAIRPALSRPTSSYRPRSAVLAPPAPLLSDLQRALEAAQRSQLGSRGSDSSSISVKGIGGETSTAPSSRPQSVHFETARQASGSSTEQAPAKDIAVAKRGARVAAAVAAIDFRGPATKKPDTPRVDPREVEEAFEAVLERRNIPEDQRRSMRSLTLHVKADFVKQDEKASRPSSPVKKPSSETIQTSRDDDVDERKTRNIGNETNNKDNKSPSKRERPRSRTFNFTKSDNSPTKKQKAASRPTSIQDANQLVRTESATPNAESLRIGSFGKSTQRPSLPEDYVEYLRQMQDPTKAEVGRVHKLRILLRNETVAWTDSFIELGGMREIIALLHRIMAIEWREDHEDQLLHESLLCLKGISTTKAALMKLEEVADELFPKLLHMIFDEEKKGPSEFTTRGIIITVLFAYLSSASTSSPSALTTRANKILTYLQDTHKADAQPLPFVLEMHSRRPYRTWCREVTNVTKEVFWIFLHQGNIIPIPRCPSDTAPVPDERAHFPTSDRHLPSLSSGLPTAPPPDLGRSYTKRHFPGTRPPVPAAPYIGGVEWDATTYVTSHLDLLNGVLASLPTAEARNELRADLRSSGWEKVMGATLRTCKEKFYAGVHDALRTWVGAAMEDGWEVDFVRTGKGEEGKGSPMKMSAREKEKVLLPELNLGLGLEGKTKAETGARDEEDEGWLV
ncbi:GTPase-binding protein rid1 [Sphaceloma murrayae]|uniref:GTPase-binding protein rid1 n=1 Tax=Sphaceloma murrayae TaxID=2082308 RepID=A0A2K1QNR5_9PEZI|nr:GTPase-binding protein rid1 [Sphaceloma murrayae]